MSKSLFSKIKTPISIFATTVATLAAVVSAANVSAWGPERTTYTNANPAPYAVFNSITDNVAVGDERNFVRVREAGTSNAYVDELEVIPGKEYEVYIYYHNDAASSTNSTGYGIATATKISSAYPTILSSTGKNMVSGIVSWSYVTPESPNDAKTGKVWDEAYFTTKVDGTVLRYKTGTAVIHNSGQANGSVISSDLFTENGTYIGFNKLTGIIPGCAEYSGHITYTLVAESTTSELTKEVSTDGVNWSNSVKVEPGDYVTYRVTFKNTGNTTMTNVIFKDVHSDDLSLRSGSTKIYDANHTDGLQIDDILDISGYNVGDVAPGALVQIIYQAKTNADIEDCSSTLSNKISVEYNGSVQQDSATNITLECPSTPVEEIENAPCDEDPTLPGCSEDPSQPEPDPEPTPTVIVSTGPVEITMAIVIILGIAGGGFYLWRTRHVLKTVENEVSGKTPESKENDAPSTTAESKDTKSQSESKAAPSSDAKKS